MQTVQLQMKDGLNGTIDNGSCQMQEAKCFAVICFRFVQLSLKHGKQRNYPLLELSALVIYEVPDFVFRSRPL
jgi:hypothetical protein